MEVSRNIARWQANGRSVRGASHKRDGLPNQDNNAIWWPRASPTGAPLVVAVADGHGSAKNFRSDRGAQFAVGVAIAEIKDIIERQPNLVGLSQRDPSTMSALKRMVEEQLPEALVRRWRRAVGKHLKEHPLEPEQLAYVEQKSGAKARAAVEKDNVIAYGATLLMAWITDSFIAYLQLGDGDIVAISEADPPAATSEAGSAIQADRQAAAEDGGSMAGEDEPPRGVEADRPLPKDERLFANETTSLCGDKAWNDFRVSFQPLYGTPPALITLSTDGYLNSFVDESAFLQVGPDLLKMIRAEGLERVGEELPAWLDEASQVGSGDDITLALVYRAGFI